MKQYFQLDNTDEQEQTKTLVNQDWYCLSLGMRMNRSRLRKEVALAQRFPNVDYFFRTDFLENTCKN